LNVIVTASGKLDPGFAVLNQTEIPVRVLTTESGERELRASSPQVEATVLADGDEIPASKIIAALSDLGAGLVLSEGGPQITGDMLAERLLDELFLTVAPQVAGRADEPVRPGLVADRLFAPDDPRWAELVSVRRAANHLFLRYAFPYED
jgi:riboflavin biosynthesis pyrimidine reductase